MLRSLKDIMNYVLEAKDGDIGRCKDFLFDDQYWAIRYMVADTGKWLPGRKVLLSPIALEEPDAITQRFPVKLTCQQIEESPPLDEHAPVSRQYEMNWLDYYGWAYYWSGAHLWGPAPYPSALYTPKLREELVEEKPQPEESHLRSVKEVKGYRIEASDGEIGHVDDFIVDDQSWSIRYLVLDTRNWLPGRRVLVAPEWVKSVHWADGRVEVDLTQEAIKNSPEYDPAAPVNREYEVRLYNYYGQPAYWEKDEARFLRPA